MDFNFAREKRADGSTRALWMTRQWVKEYAIRSPRARGQREFFQTHRPSDGAALLAPVAGEDTAALRRVIEEQSREIVELRILVAQLREVLGGADLPRDSSGGGEETASG